MAGGSNGGGGTNPNSGSGRSNVDSLSTLSKRNATNGLNSSFFQSGTTRGKLNQHFILVSFFFKDMYLNIFLILYRAPKRLKKFL